MYIFDSVTLKPYVTCTWRLTCACDFFFNNVKIALTFFSSLQFNDFDDPVGCFFYVEVLSPFLLTKYKLYESLFEYGYSGLGFASLN